jgi:alpha-1,3-glucosyltransferase
LTVLLANLFFPLLILIDHGHFQYNSISLGLALFAFIMATQEKTILLSAISFTLALNYKQMELYHALPIFVYLLSTYCFDGRRLK